MKREREESGRDSGLWTREERKEKGWKRGEEIGKAEVE